jgi:SAM-dependent MidA family methyltransferase
VKSSSKNSDPGLTRFDHFMAEALYGRNGYYTGKRTILGARGDFTTTPKIGTRLAETIAHWIKEAWKRNGRPLPIIELGPGDGTLACDIRKSLGFWDRRRLDYHFVEISPHLSARQKEINQGQWHCTLSDALESTDRRALIISNEFFDAFPVRIFNDQREELFLTPDRQERWLLCEALPDSLLLENPPARFEVAESIHRWIKEELSLLEHGEILTIDYGGTPEEVYHRRPLGTLRAYAHHMRLHPPEAYQNPGHQDLTFDVCFPELERWGKSSGLETVSYQTQAQFLGTEDHDGVGGAFKVLHQMKS